MRMKDIVRVLLGEMLVFIVVQQTWSKFAGLNQACVEQNGTVCNHRPLKECSAERLEPLPDQQRSAVNPETFFRVAVMVNSSGPTPQRYLYFEWMQDDSYQPDSVTVKVTPLLKGKTLDDLVICMSTLGHNNETQTQFHWPDSTSSRSRHSSLVPLPENVNTAIVEIQSNSGFSQYLVQVPKYSRHAWILPGVSIVTYDNKSYISISSPDNLAKSWADATRIKYTVTLVCHIYSYSSTQHLQAVDKLSMRILPRSPVTSCSKTNQEIYLQYLPKSGRPLVFAMDQLAYSIMIDAHLVTGSASQVIAETKLITPIFAYVGKTGEKSRMVSETERTKLEVSMVQDVNNDNKHLANELSALGKTSGQPSVVSQNPRLESSTVGEVHQDNKLLASELSAFSSENGETDTEGISKITWGIIAASSLLFISICLLATWRIISQKNRRRVQKQGSYEVTKNSSGKLPSTSEAGGLSSGSRRMPRFRSECCTNRASDVPSNSDISGPLISSSKSSQLTCQDNFDSKNGVCYKDLSGYLTRNNCFQIKDNACQLSYDNLPHSLSTRTRRLTKLDDDVRESDDIPNTEPEVDIDTATENSKTDYISHPPIKFSSPLNRNICQVTDFNSGSNFMLTSVGDNMYEEDDSDCEHFADDYFVVKPKLFPGHIDPMVMKAECLKINQKYEQLTGITTDRHKSSSTENFLQDECFSISESIVC